MMVKYFIASLDALFLLYECNGYVPVYR